VSTQYKPGRAPVTGIDLVRFDKKYGPQNMQPGFAIIKETLADGTANSVPLDKKLRVALQRDPTAAPLLDIVVVNRAKGERLPFGT
jgi:hypothetical protein